MTELGPRGSVGDDEGHPDDGPRFAGLRPDFDGLGTGHHVALFYESLDAQRRGAAEFVGSALDRAQQCLYLLDRNDPAAVRSAFRERGIDVAAREDDDDLRIVDAAEMYLEDGFDADRIVEMLGSAAEVSNADGYDGLAVAGENSWSFRTEADFDEIVEFEAAFDAFEPDYPVTTLCQYGIDDFDETAVAKALRTHEHVVYRGTLCRNPYYLPPERYAELSDTELNATLMLEQTHGLARSRQAIERHEQRLAVVNRVLRHDIRNDLNVVLGTVSWLRESADLDETERAQLDSVHRMVSRLVDRAEKARYVQQTLADSSIDGFDLPTVVRDAAEMVRADHPTATIDVDDQPAVSVLADGHLKTALVELLTNAVVHGTADPPSATFSTSHEGDTVTVEVVNPGPPVPEPDRTALERGLETTLEHADGLGLWLVTWIMDDSRGRLHFPDADPEECHIAVDLRVAE
jgi:two-component sensor histidine kinase